MIKSFTDFVSGPNGRAMMRKFGETLAELVKAIADYMGNLFSPAGREKIINDLVYGFKTIVIELKKRFVPGYGEEEAKKEKEMLETEKKVYDARAKSANELSKMEYDAKVADQVLHQGGVEAAKAKLEALNKEKADLIKIQQSGGKLTEEQKKKLDQLNNDIVDQDQLVKATKEMTAEQAKAIEAKKAQLQGDVAGKEAELKNAEAAKNKREESKRSWYNPRRYLGNMYADDDGKRANTTMGATGGLFEKGPAQLIVGEGGQKEGVFSEQQIMNLAKGGGKAGGQDQLVSLLQQLNMQTGQLVAYNAQVADLQKKMLSKLDWSGNLFQ
mgnify:CR=1 FL=1